MPPPQMPLTIYQLQLVECQKDIHKSIKELTRLINKIAIETWEEHFSKWPLFKWYDICYDKNKMFDELQFAGEKLSTS
jgi:hypothetical protein